MGYSLKSVCKKSFLDVVLFVDGVWLDANEKRTHATIKAFILF